MIKIVMTCRNRLEVTKKAIEALYAHTKQDFQLYCYDNLTSHNVKEHFEYFWKLYDKGLIAQITFNTKESTFNAFSKAASLNSFGMNHEQDPQKDVYDFLTIIDNDIIVTPDWDILVNKLWRHTAKKKLQNIHIISQLPGGIKDRTELPDLVDGHKMVIGKLGGSGFWNVKPDFYRKIGYLNLKRMVGLNKKHDQHTWAMLNKASGGNPYILGVATKLAFHVGGMVGSVCNVMTHGGTENQKMEKIKFQHAEDKIKKMTFDEFYLHASTKYRGW